MALFKHEIPILEHDTNPVAVLGHDRPPLIQLPPKAVFAFLGDMVDRYAVESGAEILEVYETITRHTNIYRIQHRGEEICLCRAPLGGPAAVQLMDWLIGHGVRKIITAGSCGTLAPLPENSFLIPAKALRDEGISYHYLPSDRYVDTSSIIRDAIKEVLSKHGLQFTECITWTTDGFYRETEDMIAYRREEGCLTVEMECASLAACAKFRNAEFGQLLYTADSLADAARYDARNWGKDSRQTALELCLEIAANM